MSLASVLASIVWPTVSSGTFSTITPSDPDDLYNVIRGHITHLYNGSTTAAQVLEAAATAHVLIFVRTTGQNAAVTVGSLSALAINMTEINEIYYFNDKGQLVHEIPELTIIHEVIHRAPPALGDPLPWPQVPSNAMMKAGFDFDGDTVRKQNVIAGELGHLNNIQKNYYGNAQYNTALWNQFDRSISYSEGRTIDTPVIPEGEGVGNDDLAPITLGAGGVVIPDAVHVIFGLAGDDTLNGKGGSDYLYGGGDDDKFIGSKGDDLFHGGGTRTTSGGVVSLEDDGIETGDNRRESGHHRDTMTAEIDVGERAGTLAHMCDLSRVYSNLSWLPALPEYRHFQ